MYIISTGKLVVNQQETCTYEVSCPQVQGDNN